MTINSVKNTVSVILAIALVVFLFYYFGIRKTNTEVSSEQLESQKSASELQNEKILDALKNKYNAIEYISTENPTTLSMQTLFMGNQPIIFTGHVEDVFARDGKYYITATTRDFQDSDVWFELKCSKEVAEGVNETVSSISEFDDIFSDDASIKNKFAVIAKIKNISRPQFRAIDFSENETIEVQTDSDMFLLKGECVDIVNY